MADYKECKFYKNSKCKHEDAPPNSDTCIGKDNCGVYQDDIKHHKNYKPKP